MKLIILIFNFITHIPHNIFFQVLFENGIIGFVVIFGALGAFVRNLWRGIRRPAPDSTRYLYSLCFFIFSILFMHTLLTKSLYSKYIVYLFSMTLGTALALDLRCGQTKTLAQLFPNIFSETQSWRYPT